MSAISKATIKEGIQNFKYELMFIKHKLDLVENIINGLEEKVYSDEPGTELDDKLLNFRVNMLLDEYQKLRSLIKPDKIKFQNEENYQQVS